MPADVTENELANINGCLDANINTCVNAIANADLNAGANVNIQILMQDLM